MNIYILSLFLTHVSFRWTIPLRISSKSLIMEKSKDYTYIESFNTSLLKTLQKD